MRGDARSESAAVVVQGRPVFEIHQPGGPVTTQEQRVVNPQEQIAARGTLDSRPIPVTHCALPQTAPLS